MLERLAHDALPGEAEAHSALDVLIAGDMTTQDDMAFRVAEEIRHFAREGYRVGLMQAASPVPGSKIAPEIQTCVRRGLAAVIDPAARPETTLLIIHRPSTIDWSEQALAGIRAKSVTLVVHCKRDYHTTRVRQRLRGSKTIVWAPTNPWLRKIAPNKLAMRSSDWLPPRSDATAGRRSPGRVGAPAIGWVMTEGMSTAAMPSLEPLDVHLLALGAAVPQPAPMPVLDAGQVSLDRLANLDALAYFPDETTIAFPETVLRFALSCGMPVLLPERLKSHFGTGPKYCTAETAAAELARILDETRHSGRGAQRNVHALASDAPTGSRPIMFLASNGVGVGHLTRLLAIARCVKPDVPVVFVSQAQAIDAVERFGYRAEYLPSAHYIGGDFSAWDRWFGFELERLIESYDPALVVYDGNNPSHGLVRAVAGRRDCRLAWVRRGLWGDTVSRFFDNARWFDLIIEPGELDGQPDEGITARRRAEAVTVPPIRLLDGEDLLAREEAAAALGLDPKKPAVLVQLGAGYNRDIVSLMDELVGVLRQVPHLQICIAEWLNGAQSLNYWPEVKYLRGYPLSQYFRAFDFSIAAAGYNTFHEVIGLGLPTVFIPNRHPTMDDQGGRAEHAQALQAAFELPDNDLEDLPQLVALLADAKARAFLADKCQRIAQPNGAADAARMLEELAWTAQ
ncbi:glycosyltransferase [Pelagibacterium sp. H642]|uniref:glycosyltransferase n=1 Tax=Pelagibacterium sp. H642 TaxID=1881069 RepID=UPI0028156D0B|nr:glycosyltransferase [Pelagibacterium sp. H642]WMT91981.1 hypothetical protein NO934_06920 [Pelagibacterium sp. H642]